MSESSGNSSSSAHQGSTETRPAHTLGWLEYGDDVNARKMCPVARSVVERNVYNTIDLGEEWEFSV